MATYRNLSPSSSSGNMQQKERLTTDKALNGMGKLIRLLPTGTVFFFQVLNPVFTNNGNCHRVNKIITALLLFVCSFSCCFSNFTDSYVTSDGVVHYGIATINGLWPTPTSSTVAASAYKLRFRDFVHAFWTVIVFAVVSLLDPDTMKCYYPSFATHDKWLVMLLPPVVGFFASIAFFIFPNKRHGIGSSET
ncbi:hypothetical protein NE237_013132 [Protea cynaroides]|uniref:Uncharacterized protein n=1 Tax=Protea cynaroides TaxID=273540 RepID=A0A9Q0H394_9MAGN|nr:hypothetical protein NE237_013132 [Protea cynaroides]